MIRGVSFKINQKDDGILWKILNCINVSKYNWYSISSQKEAWSLDNGSAGKDFLEEVHYTGKGFFDAIKEKHRIIFLKLEAYLQRADNFDIHTYEDFQKSECKIVFLLFDCEFVEVYAKEISVIESIYENALQNNFFLKKRKKMANDNHLSSVTFRSVIGINRLLLLTFMEAYHLPFQL